VGSTGTVDLNQYTIGTVNAGAVVSNVRAESNNSDSTALTGSTTHNGTTGNTIAPDLTGVTVITSANTVNYVFNKNIGGAEVTPGIGFYIINSGGQVCRQTNPAFISFSANVVTVVFPTAGGGDCPAFTSFPKSTTAAVRAGLDAGVVGSATTEGDYNMAPQTATVPGTSGTTGLADLTSAVLSSDGNRISYTFDKPIGSADSGDFVVELADNSVEYGTGTATITNTATTGTVNVTFAAGSQFNEYNVKAAVYPSAATVLNEPGVSNTYGEVPVGDNAGAFARGFTTGPDATAVTFNSTTGQAVVSFDQRVDLITDTPDPSGFVLLDSNGSPVAGAAATGISGVPSAAGPVQVTVDYPPAAFSVAKAIEICGEPSDISTAQPAECGPGTGGGSVFSSFEQDPNVQQILSPFATSAVLKAGSHAHWKHATRLSSRAFAHQLAAARHRAHARHTHHRNSR
jgi:hypothetical protein